MKRKLVTVLMGGPDAEREVSIQSGTAVANALEQSNKYEVRKIVLDTPSAKDIEIIQADVIFPVLHGPFGEGGPLQKLLEDAGKIFVGADSQSSSVAMDKIATKQIAVELEIKTPEWCVISEDTPCTIEPPLVLKPINDGSSYDVALCFTKKEIEVALERLLQNRTDVLAEKYVGGRELTVGIIGKKLLPIIEIIPPKDIKTYDYEAKYEREDTRFIIAPQLPNNSCNKTATTLYNHMGIRDIARVDFILNESGAWLLEINTMPGFTNHSLIPMAARHIGVEMPELCSSLVEFASSRRVKC
ncbi:MAG: D-alanine--D-alanine ligase [Phycisphaerales bacterium]|nr:D-alanine--D-alanine ligase [Planctomycetota bacterium]MBL6997687.1 D-alanine--D-alanine ligase [Phycisphaerales bacterium]